MFHIVKTLVYRGVDIFLVQQEEDDKIYIPRDCIRKALQYVNSGQISKMQSRYSKIFQSEYIRDFTLQVPEGGVVNGTGLYTIRGMVEVCSHTQKFRAADALMDFLKHELNIMGVQELFPEIAQIHPFTVFDKTERELLIQINLHMSKIEKILEDIKERLTEEDNHGQTE
ncbi:MAG: hypothetical protein K0R00_20 [Herbinix sp.]|jgi:hypothetical protein|nr:hypothetical protein [Herbinix sp.]